MIDISVVINSAALGAKSRDGISSCGIPYGERAVLLRERILPALVACDDVDEVVVAGEFEAGEGYRYVLSPSVQFDCTDALKQRHDGFKASHGRIVVFQHDDHFADEKFFTKLREYVHDDSWDVLVPSRWAMDNGTPRKLNNGSDDGYIMGHACAIRRSIVEMVPWSNVPKVFTWDVSHTDLIWALGARIKWVDDLEVWDLEGRATGYGW